jgi:transcriptional regulator with XRE-family HTH domain
MPEKEHVKKALAHTIFYFRRQTNVKRSYLATRLGVSLATIDKIEQAVTHPGFGQVYLLCQAMQISLADFTLVFEQQLEKFTPPPPKP